MREEAFGFLHNECICKPDAPNLDNFPTLVELTRAYQDYYGDGNFRFAKAFDKFGGHLPTKCSWKYLSVYIRDGLNKKGQYSYLC